MKTFIRFFTYIAFCCAVYFYLVYFTDIGGIKDTSKAVAFEREVDVKVYFAIEAPDGACSPLEYVTKKVYNAETLGLGALEKLLLGTSIEDRRNGLVSMIDQGVRLNTFDVVNDVAYVSFDRPLSSDPESCAYKTAINQIEKTLTSLPDIKKIEIE